MPRRVHGTVDTSTAPHAGNVDNAGRGRLEAAPSKDSDRALLERQRVAFERAAGILRDAANPDWATPEQTSAWVRRLRAGVGDATEERRSPDITP